MGLEPARCFHLVRVPAVLGCFACCYCPFFCCSQERTLYLSLSVPSPSLHLMRPASLAASSLRACYHAAAELMLTCLLQSLPRIKSCSRRLNCAKFPAFGKSQPSSSVSNRPRSQRLHHPLASHCQNQKPLLIQ